jgi:hypothetical protein
LTEVFENPHHIEVWEAARRGEQINWQEFLSSYEVAVDWPACSFYEELMEAFPEAVVILTVRDPEPWYKSMRSTIYQLSRLTKGPTPLRMALCLVGIFAPRPTGIIHLADRLVWEDTFDGRFEDREYARDIFERSNEAVRRRIPPERLLVFDVREGWGPLSSFLGVEIPDKPFPHLNETKEMQRRLFSIVVLSAAIPSLITVVGITAVVMLFRHFLYATSHDDTKVPLTTLRTSP